jgi:hypothetical protein
MFFVCGTKMEPVPLMKSHDKCEIDRSFIYNSDNYKEFYRLSVQRTGSVHYHGMMPTAVRGAGYGGPVGGGHSARDHQRRLIRDKREENPCARTLKRQEQRAGAQALAAKKGAHAFVCACEY